MERTRFGPGPNLDRTYWTRSEVDPVQVQVLVDRTLRLVIVTGNPGVSQSYPYPYPRLPVPVLTGTGFNGLG